MMTMRDAPGIYGKAPSHGDFLTRRLPRLFVDNWDAWLRSALAASRNEMDSHWLDVYLTSPIWRFVLSAGNCGPEAWAGVLMPSVDSVGRYFPLTLAAPVHRKDQLPSLLSMGSEWFDKLEMLALSALDDDFDLEEFDRKLQKESLALSPAMGNMDHDVSPTTDTEESRKNGPFAFKMQMGALTQIRDAFSHLSTRLLAEFVPVYSLWCTSGSEHVKPSLLAFKGLPPAETYTDFLAGEAPRPEREKTAAESGLQPLLSVPALTADAGIGETEGEQPAGGLPTLHWHSNSCTTVGCVRKINEDAYLERPEIGLWVVADGMGGHKAGDVASKTVVEALAAIPGSDNLETLGLRVTERLKKVNADLLEMAAQYGVGQIIGSTAVILLGGRQSFSVIWLGDSRLYRYRDGVLSQVTHDHSFVSEMVDRGTITPEEIEGNPFGNMLTRALGAEPDTAADVITEEARAGDIYLLCSDGLFRELAANEMASILSGSDFESISRKLIDLALDRGAHDNVTAIVARADSEKPEPRGL